jgi:hypothetical protein
VVCGSPVIIGTTSRASATGTSRSPHRGQVVRSVAIPTVVAGPPSHALDQIRGVDRKGRKCPRRLRHDAWRVGESAGDVPSTSSGIFVWPLPRVLGKGSASRLRNLSRTSSTAPPTDLSGELWMSVLNRVWRAAQSSGRRGVDDSRI